MSIKRVPLSKLKRFMPYLANYKKEIFFGILLGLTCGVSNVFLTYQIGVSVDLLLGKGLVDFSKLLVILGQFLLILLVAVVSQFIIQKIGNQIAYQVVADLRKEAFEHLNQLPLRYYDQTLHGTIVSRFTNDMDNISIAVAAVFNQLFSGFAVVIVALGFMLKLSLPLTCVVLVSTPIIFLVNWLVARSSQANFASQQAIVGEISGFINEMVGNQKIVKAFQREAENQVAFETMNQELNVRGQKAQFASSLTNPSSRFIDHLAYLAIGFTGGCLILKGDSHLTIGIISSFFIYASQFSKPFIELSGITTQIQTAITGLERTFALLNEKPESPDLQTVAPVTNVQGKIQFKNVSFAYEKDQPLITDFNFTAEPGETIAIVGKTGAGKSTLVNLLMRFYEVDQGMILLDNHDIREFPRDALRQDFGMVLQDTWLFDGTLRDNLTYGNPQASDQEIQAVLEKTYLADFVNRLPEKLATPLGSSGLKISEGQRQLLTIARTMLSHPPMLILDEATSSVDTLTEKKIQDAFLTMMAGRTSFVIAHRLATIQTADQILVMDQGKIVEQGTHQQLLQKNGYYAQLQQAQFSQ
ncbi:ATP-binding cassette subfamily B multidrug efflux pump [Enterococcus sp. PF1-24]|uniref:ABC transporter ATP-binding protein n=1 Tax=unclassified Enterococcus TaxID=2608891 RepID=UPI00247664D8|nr:MULTISPECIES: ABC transporter ATP-binding protein [unclassified Enterococcus]MDH6365505.1 ATP-binding cassette subfamily B multidrug efflux pump [Enterococcus sp. PFB1-1]MDH6402606.1 ATP-binding cassette subfamily B multidrug efflux pump [Enterococcus sp. PF1-24]